MSSDIGTFSLSGERGFCRGESELDSMLPQNLLNPQYLPKKQNVFKTIVAFVKKFKSMGGEIECRRQGLLTGACCVCTLLLHIYIQECIVIGCLLY